WDRNSGGGEHFAANFFAKIALVLHGIVQRDLGQAVKALFVFLLVENQRQCRLGVEGAEAPGTAFEMEEDIAVSHASLAHDCYHVTPLPGGRSAAVVLEN